MKSVLGWIGALALVLSCVDVAQCGHPGGCGQPGCNQCNPGFFSRLFGGLCFSDDCGSGCRNGHCGHGGGHFGGGGGPGGAGGGHFGQGGAYAGGPPTPTVVYPYYTTRGPRDFLDPNPRGIGP